MKHLTYATIFVLMTMQPLMASFDSINTSCESINTEQQLCKNVAGCMDDPKDSSTCMACPPGLYGAGCEKSCTASDMYDTSCPGCEWEYKDFGFMVDDCHWNANCPAGYYWSDDSGCQACDSDEFTPYSTWVVYESDTIENNGYASCQKCGTNSTGIRRDDISDSGGCQCKSGYHLQNSREDDIETNTGADCVPATYRIRIYKNRPWIENDNEYITLYVRFNQTGFVTQGAPTNDNSRDSWFESASKTTTVPNVDDGKNNRYRINGYTADTPCDVNDCPEPILVPGDVYSAPITDFTRDTDLYACYNTTTYSIMYLSDTQSTGTYETDSFEYNTPLQSAMYVEDVYEHAPRFYVLWDGKIFSHWSCYNSTCNDTEIYPGDPIPEPNAPYPQTQLIAVLKDCGTGKYCKNNEESYCPAGTTTLITTATSKEACKLTNKTKFKDNTDLIFSLPISDSTTISIK